MVGGETAVIPGHNLMICKYVYEWFVLRWVVWLVVVWEVCVCVFFQCKISFCCMVVVVSGMGVG